MCCHTATYTYEIMYCNFSALHDKVIISEKNWVNNFRQNRISRRGIHDSQLLLHCDPYVDCITVSGYVTNRTMSIININHVNS